MSTPQQPVRSFLRSLVLRTFKINFELNAFIVSRMFYLSTKAFFDSNFFPSPIARSRCPRIPTISTAQSHSLVICQKSQLFFCRHIAAIIQSFHQLESIFTCHSFGSLLSITHSRSVTRRFFGLNNSPPRSGHGEFSCNRLSLPKMFLLQVHRIISMNEKI